jgi:Tol biopolymer transport system component
MHRLLALLVLAGCAHARLHHPQETHLTDIRQLTFGGENAEAYWSPDGKELVFQSTRPPHRCDQIFRMPVLGPAAAPALVSPGAGRATCAYFLRGAERVLFSSTHHLGAACPPPPDRSQGYVWALYDYDLFTARPDGTDLRPLARSPGYDAEATVCPRDGSVVFTSTRDGDLEIYRMDEGGGNVRRLTRAPGYDGGAFFSPDCSKIVWRASRPQPGPELDDYRRLLRRGLVRQTRLEIWVANSDGTEARQVTHLGAASFAPAFFPSGERIVFSTNHGDPRGREFDLWAVNVDGTVLERITYAPGFDGFPMFSPDGKRLAFASNRTQSRPGETNVYVARWVDYPPRAPERAADRVAADVRWLADPAREGRALGSAGLEAAASWLESRMRALGLAPAGEAGGYRQPFEARTGVREGPGTELSLDGSPVPRDQFRAAPFSLSGEVAGEVVAAGYGISAPELGADDYHGLDARGKVVVVRRFTPEDHRFARTALRRRYGDLRFKAWNARTHGAAALIVVDLPEVAAGRPLPPEAAFPSFPPDGQGDIGIPVIVVARALAPRLLRSGARVRLRVSLRYDTRRAVNLVGKIEAGAKERLGGALVVGAHYDHLGLGGPGSFVPGVRRLHPGADDNASGTAALLEIARLLAKRRAELGRDVYVVAFSGEESGVLGSTTFTRRPPEGLAPRDLVAMLNLDMVGRLRENTLSVLGGGSAPEWEALVASACRAQEVTCKTGGDGYGPSDHSPFYAAGVPVLHFFTGAHREYHRPEDVAALVNAAGVARAARVVADLAASVAGRPARLTYRAAPNPAVGDVRSFGAYLGTVPDYVGPPDGRTGMLLAGVRPRGPADRAGLRRGDLLLKIGTHDIRNVRDLVFVLRAAKPGEKAVAVVERDGKRLELEVTFGRAPGRTR